LIQWSERALLVTDSVLAPVETRLARTKSTTKQSPARPNANTLDDLQDRLAATLLIPKVSASRAVSLDDPLRGTPND
jgi:hypothetical protein